MPPSLRQHVANADEIMACLGVRTLIPQRGMPAPVRVDASDRQREYALSVLIPLEAYDRTGWVRIYLRASRQAAGAIWDRIPDHHVCPVCLARVIASRVNLGTKECAGCKETTRAATLKGIVGWDIRRIKKRLRDGGIGVD